MDGTQRKLQKIKLSKKITGELDYLNFECGKKRQRIIIPSRFNSERRHFHQSRLSWQR